jgi:hypothetical protein
MSPTIRPPAWLADIPAELILKLAAVTLLAACICFAMAALIHVWAPRRAES